MVESSSTFTDSLRNDFKPEVEQWGQRGIVQCVAILDCAKGPVPSSSRPELQEEEAEKLAADKDLELSPAPSIHGSLPPESKSDSDMDGKRQKTMTLEEYEAMLDDEIFDGIESTAAS